jgi:hypothetical protein
MRPRGKSYEIQRWRTGDDRIFSRVAEGTPLKSATLSFEGTQPWPLLQSALSWTHNSFLSHPSVTADVEKRRSDPTATASTVAAAAVERHVKVCAVLPPRRIGILEITYWRAGDEFRGLEEPLAETFPSALKIPITRLSQNAVLVLHMALHL